MTFKNFLKIKDIDIDSHILNLSRGVTDIKLTDLYGIEKYTNLTWLDLNNNKIEDITPLKYLINLHTLDLRNNNIKDFTPLIYLKKLCYIDMKKNINLDYNFCANYNDSYQKLNSLLVRDNRKRKIELLNI